MIEISNENERATFTSYEDLLNHICQTEKKKSLEAGVFCCWRFTVYSHEELTKDFMTASKVMEILVTKKEQEAYENNLELLEIYKGNPDESNQIILTDDVNIDELMKDWCRDYCLSNGYRICERN